MTSRIGATRLLAGLVLAMGLVGSVVAFGGRSASSASVDPVFVAGNPTCAELGYDFGLRVDPPNAGTYDTDGIHSVTVTRDGVNFDWESDLGMDAVIAKGGPNANVYVYDPPAESFGDTGLHSPINPNNSQPFGLSHIDFCFDYEVDVAKDAETTFKRSFDWTIDKSADTALLELEVDESGTVGYTVEVTKSDGVDSDWAVSGTITIENNTPLTATITGVSDVVSTDIAADVDCGVTFPYDLASGATLSCDYNTDLPDGTNRTNTATVSTSGQVGGGGATAAVVFGDEPSELIDESATVTDTNTEFGGPKNTGTSNEYTYDVTLDCDEEGTYDHDNTATVTEDDTGETDDDTVTVTVVCVAGEEETPVPTPTPEPEFGCTPGFWKNNLSKHGASAFPDSIQASNTVPGTSLTYAEALVKTGKGIYYAHLASAYLNLATYGDDYGLTADEIAGASLAELTAANEAGCTLSQNG